VNFDSFTDGLPDDIKDEAERVGFDAYDAFEPTLGNDGNKQNRSTRFAEIKRRMVSLNAIEAVLTCNYLTKGWLTANGLSMLYGPSNACKTFVAIGHGMHVASGEPWMGCKVNPGPVLYIAAEGGSGVLNRLAAFKRENPDMADAPFTLLPTAVDFFASDDAEIITALLSENPPVLIIIDTLARSMGDGDENTSKDMGVFVKNCDRIREATGAHVMIVHHSGKNASKGARGSSALRAAVDTEIAVHGDREVKRIHCEKQRDMAFPGDLWFRLKSVELGVDEDGDTVTSAVVIASERPSQESKAKPLKGRDEVAMNALKAALAEHGRTDMGDDYPAGVTVVSLDDWRDKCAQHELTTGSSDSAARQAFKRAKDRLLELDKVRGFNEYFWRVSE